MFHMTQEEDIFSQGKVARKVSSGEGCEGFNKSSHTVGEQKVFIFRKGLGLPSCHLIQELLKHGRTLLFFCFSNEKVDTYIHHSKHCKFIPYASKHPWFCRCLVFGPPTTTYPKRPSSEQVKGRQGI